MKPKFAAKWVWIHSVKGEASVHEWLFCWQTHRQTNQPTNKLQTKGQRASHSSDVRMPHHHHHLHQHHHHHHHATSTTPPATACITGTAPHFCIWMFSWSLRSSSKSLSCSFSWICSISLAAPISCSSLRCRSISSWILMEAWRSTCTPSHKNS